VVIAQEFLKIAAIEGTHMSFQQLNGIHLVLMLYVNVGWDLSMISVTSVEQEDLDVDGQT
jgi:hypothetical protein